MLFKLFHLKYKNLYFNCQIQIIRISLKQTLKITQFKVSTKNKNFKNSNNEYGGVRKKINKFNNVYIKRDNLDSYITIMGAESKSLERKDGR